MGDSDQLRADARERFWIPPDQSQLFSTLDIAIASLLTEYRSPLDAFRHNLNATISTISIPFALASGSAHQSHFQRFHMAERIRAGGIEPDAVPHGETLERFRNRKALEIASRKMSEFAESKEGIDAIADDICAFLLDSLKGGSLEGAAQELLRQGELLLWSAFEVLFRDIFETLLNSEPERAQDLVAHPTTRKRFDAEKLPLELLLQHGLNLSQTLGSVLVTRQDLSDLPTVKAIYSVLFPSSPELASALADVRLWSLFQRRHLIVHRRGVVDRSYIDSTGDSCAIGTVLRVLPVQLERDLEAVAAAGTSLCKCLPNVGVTA